MRKLTKIVPLAAMLVLLGCEDNATECERLFNDKPKQLLAFDYCKKAADEGDAIAQLRTAELLFQQGDDAQAVEYLTKSANQLQPQALYLIAQHREQNGMLDGATFYYEQSCKLNVMSACEWLAKQKQEAQKQAEAKDKARLQAELATAEKARKEAEQKQLAEQKARQEAERLKQDAEKKAKHAEEQARLETERAKKDAEEKIRLAETQTENTHTLPRINQTELRQTFSDFAAEAQRANFSYAAFETWVKNCYTNSNFKKGCFYFDLLASLTDELLSYQEKSRKRHDFFNELYVRNRAYQHIPEFQRLSEAQFEMLIKQVSDDLLSNSHLFEDMHNVRQIRLAKKPTHQTAADPSLQKFEQNGLWGFTDQYGNIVINAQFLAIGGFYHERAAVQSAHNRMWGFIDKSGNWVVDPQFCIVGRFSEGLAGVYHNGYLNTDNQCVGGKWGYLNTNGNWVINPVFEYAERFKNGKAKVAYQGYTGYINQSGQWVE